jgi:hypothetical protein
MFNVPDRVSAQLEVLFKSPGWERFSLLTAGKPHVAVVDLDAPNPDRVWSAYRKRYPETPSVILSATPQERDGAVWITKPVSPAALKTAILRARQGPANPPAPAAAPSKAVTSRPREDVSTRTAASALDAEVEDRCCGNAADIDPENPESVARATYSTSGCFQALVRQCFALVLQDGVPRAIDGLPAPFVVHRTGVETAIRDNVLRSLCIVALREDVMRVRELAGAQPSGTLQPLAPALWQIALWSARGRLARDIPLDAPVRLRHWPVFTRWIETPNAMRIAALLVGSPHTALDAARALGVPHRHVFPLLSAAHAVGLLEILPGHASAPRVREERRTGLDRREVAAGEADGERREVPERRGILRRILGRLVGA